MQKAAWRTFGRRLRPQPGLHPAGHTGSEIPEILIAKAFRLAVHFSLMNNTQLSGKSFSFSKDSGTCRFS